MLDLHHFYINNNPAATGRPSDNNTLNVRQAAAVSITSTPIPASSRGAVSAGEGKLNTGPVPSNKISAPSE